ncbi:SOS response-associated peptidase family protein [Sphingomonas sp. ZT3P38]|uniref:SOS response-associated peptidase n=1 Tax=Parasphingomonas zepuensis TaxID=3096161 RepID=UPI002FC7ED08
MCNLYNLKVTRAEIVAYFEANDDWRQDLEKDYVSPSREGLVVTSAEGTRSLTGMRWGFPHWQPGQKEVVNVRNYGSSFWRSALKNPERRCLVPFTEFQEWSVEPDPVTGKKTKHWFSIPSRPIGVFAGVWRPTDTGPRFAFLTCGYSTDPDAEKEAAAVHIVGAIHPKAIPVILHDEDFDRWLQAPIDEALGLACAFPSQLLSVK